MHRAPLRPTPPRTPLLLLACLLLGGLVGCAADRSLILTSEPPGADVWVDDDRVGVTPVKVEFFHYGTRRVTMRMEGYGTFSQKLEVSPPWYGRFPIDIVSEVLLPIGWDDHHPLHVVLERGEDDLTLPTLRSVLERAETLRRAGPSGPQELPPVELTETQAAEDEQDDGDPRE